MIDTVQNYSYVEIQKFGVFWRNCRARWLICSNLWFIVAALLNWSSSSSDSMRKRLPYCITMVPHVLANFAKIWRIIKVSISRQMNMGAWPGVRISVSPRTSSSYQSFEKFWKTSFFCVETLPWLYIGFGWYQPKNHWLSLCTRSRLGRYRYLTLWFDGALHSSLRIASSQTCATSIIDDLYQLIIFVMCMSRKHKGLSCMHNALSGHCW